MLRPIATAIFMLALPLVLACTSDDDPSAGAYFEALESAKQQHDAALPRGLALASSNEQVVELLDEENEILRTFVDRLEALEAPDSLGQDHTLAVQLTRQRLGIQEEIAQNYIAPERSFFDTADYRAAAIERREGTRVLWYGAICSLGLRAADQDIAIELGCTSEQALALRVMDHTTVTLPTGTEACASASEPRPAELATGQVTYAQWFNRHDQPVQLYRVERSNEPQLVTTIDSDGTSVQITTIGTGWFVTDQQGNCIGGYFPSWPAVNVDIQ